MGILIVGLGVLYRVFLLPEESVPVITGLLQFLQTRLMTAPTTHAAPAVAGKDVKKPEADTSQMMQQQMTIMMPLMIGVFAFSFPFICSFKLAFQDTLAHLGKI